jgi:hypothetical protein
MPVKDKSGVVIGSVLDVRPDERGQRTVTLRMGAESFAIDAPEAELKGFA